MTNCTCNSIRDLCDYHQRLLGERYEKSYIIEAEPTKPMLEDSVNKAITLGYRPIGGIIFRPIDGEALRDRGNSAWSRNWGGMYYQALYSDASWRIRSDYA